MFGKAPAKTDVRLIVMNGKPCYIPDTNVYIDYPNAIPNGNHEQPQEPTIDLSHANIIVTVVTIYELDRIVHDREKPADLRIIAKELIRRICNLIAKNFGPVSLSELNSLSKPLVIEDDDRCFFIVPMHKNFMRSLPYNLDESNPDDAILATVFAVKLALQGIAVDGTAKSEEVEEAIKNDDRVTLLTNDCRFRATALMYGVNSLPFEYKVPEPYTGRRDVVVPKDFFIDFLGENQISLEKWEKAMPNQPPLVANEYLVMYEEGVPRDEYDDILYRRIGYYDVKAGAIVHIKKTHVDGIQTTNPGQVIYLDALSRPDITAVIAKGPAGSGKTYTSTIWSLSACRNHRYLGSIIVPRQDDNGLGALPGDLNNKMDLYVQPVKDSLRSYFQRQFKKHDIVEEDDEDEEVNSKPKKRRKKSYDEEDEAYPAHKKSRGDSSSKENRKKSKDKSPMRAVENSVMTTWTSHFQVVPIANAKGRSFQGLFVFCDEFQDQNITAATTMITRLGEGAKLVLSGDIDQIHAPHINRGNSGLTYASAILKGNPMAAQVTFLENEVKRSEFVRSVVESLKKQRTRNEQ